jgi:hypothetical protein
MPYLPFISDDVLIHEVQALLNKVKTRQASAEKSLEKNVIDPFAFLFESIVYNEILSLWEQNEARRQVQKTLSNALGDFHQNILSACEGWQNLRQGNVFHICHPERRIIAEIKNKFNTIKASDRYHTYEAFDASIHRKDSRYRGCTAYLVEVVPNKIRYDKPFTPSNNKDGTRCATKEDIRVIDGYSFYALATGEADALTHLAKALIEVIQKHQGLTELDASIPQGLTRFIQAAYC